MLDQSFRMFRTNQCRCVLTLTARVSGVGENYPVVPLLSGHADLLCIDNNYIVTAVHMRRIAWLMLSPDNFRNLTCYAAQHLSVRVHHNPAFFNGGLVGVSRLIAIMIHFFA